MALNKTRTVKGVEVSYYKIIHCDICTGKVLVMGFASREMSQNESNSIGPVLFYKISIDKEAKVKTLDYAYTEIVKSKPKTEKVKQEDGTYLDVTTETNELYGATPILEAGQKIEV